jgi:hypothetical protein
MSLCLHPDGALRMGRLQAAPEKGQPRAWVKNM